MTADGGAGLRDPVFGDLGLNWRSMLALGLFVAALGIVGLGLTRWLTLVSVVWFGVLLLVGGIAQVVQAFKASGWRSIAAHVLVGLLYSGIGVVLVALPVPSAWWLTLIVGAGFVGVGVLRLVIAVEARGGGSAPLWLALSGIVSVALGVLVFSVVGLPQPGALATVGGARSWFASWGWVLGLFVATEFIAHGASLVALALSARERHGARAGATAGAP